MKQGQEKFLEFILERVQEDKVNEAKSLLSESFKKQTDGTFSKEYIMEFIPKMISLLKADKVEEVKAIMEQFAKNINN
ncbi:MAG: hypothetical protein HUJ77_06875 [Clostridium sp.]|uniref:hypothetical protein n=1 Tax=Clostridium sp. TaxID=1506 RepID=UPI0025B7F141|nr:hypothetical protein [Clostridium sp.]MCF0148106.1 hypothetical protein [Clostridium sp.]